MIEMLIVVGIITLLIAILMPALSNAKRQAQTTVCAEQMRRLYCAVVAYANDNHGLFPKPPPVSAKFPEGDQTGKVKKENYAWVMSSAGVANFEVGTLVSYMGPDVKSRERLMKCPADDGNTNYRWNPNGTNVQITAPHNFSYAFNAFMNFQYTDGPAQKFNCIRRPERKVMIWELRSPFDALVCYCGGTELDKITDRHFGMANLIFADGHRELLPADQVMKSPEYFRFTDNQADCGSHWDKFSDTGHQ